MKAKGKIVPASALVSIDALAKYAGVDKSSPILQALWALKEAREVSFIKAGRTIWKSRFVLEKK